MIRGYSGCSIEIKPPYLIKSNGNTCGVRLLVQACKQINALKTCNSENIIIPEIHDISQVFHSHSPLETIIKMDYYPAMDSISFLETATIPEIDKWLSTILNYIRKNLENSKVGPAKHRLLEDTIEVELGPTHGDLTLSNILEYQGKVVLIDFLDGFESPLIDIAKLRQDTKYRWSFFLSGRINKRLEIILDYLDKRIVEFGQEFETYRKYGRTLEHLCLNRILPYCQEESHKTFISEALCLP